MEQHWLSPFANTEALKNNKPLKTTECNKSRSGFETLLWLPDQLHPVFLVDGLAGLHSQRLSLDKTIAGYGVLRKYFTDKAAVRND